MGKRTPLLCQQLENISREALEKYQDIIRQYVSKSRILGVRINCMMSSWMHACQAYTFHWSISCSGGRNWCQATEMWY